MPDYKVTFPDGHIQQFSGPEMNDVDVQNRAIQERAFAEGRIPTTWLGGASKALGEDKATTQAILSGVGYATGQPEIVAGAPLAARGIQYATRRATGQNPEPPSASELATDAATGAAQGYGPSLLTNATKGLAASTVAHQSPITGQWVKGVSGSGVMPWAVRTAGEAANALSKSPVGRAVAASQPGYLATGLGGAGGTAAAAIAAQYALMKEAIAKGQSAYAAARQAAGNDAPLTQVLLAMWSRNR